MRELKPADFRTDGLDITEDASGDLVAWGAVASGTFKKRAKQFDKDEVKQPKGYRVCQTTAYVRWDDEGPHSFWWLMFSPPGQKIKVTVGTRIW